MKSKFELTLENYTGKYTKGGFLPGDFVKFKKEVFNDPDVASGSDGYKAKIKELIDSDKHLRISSLTNKSATRSADADGTAGEYVATIYQTAPGNSAISTDNVITVPLKMLDKVARTSDETQVKVPDSFKRAADKKINHTNDHKETADKLDSSYDDGKDFNNGERNNVAGKTPDEFDKDSDASGVRVKKKVNESKYNNISEGVRHSYNIKDLVDKLSSAFLDKVLPTSFVQKHTGEVIIPEFTKMTKVALKKIATEARRGNLLVTGDGEEADKVRRGVVRHTNHPSVVRDEEGFNIQVRNLKA